uniref:RNase H type-1 domain-containing protein n=1 Tax=Cannabis sativa TaxID=3483 RepID=A0A803P8J4_CANSA
MIHGIKISRNAPPISHLMFADDTILFARANTREAENLLLCLNTYEAWSGQQCSKPKSSVLISNNIPADKKKEILQALSIDEVNGEEKHLGNPFIFKRRKRENYVKLKESMLQKLEGWKMKLLSYAGRLTLIKSVAAAMPIYMMSTNKVPISTCRGLDAILRKGEKQNLKGVHHVGADGSSIDFWNQPWIPWLDHNEFKELMDRLKLKRFTVKTIADISIGNEWNKEMVIPIFGEELGNKIMDIPRLPFPYRDRIIWKESQDGVFSVKRAYGVDQRFVTEKECPLCYGDIETSLHLFKECSFAKALWFSGPFPMRIEEYPGESMIDFLCHLIKSFPNCKRSEMITYSGCILDQIWRQRNNCLLSTVNANIDQARYKVLKAFSEMTDACLKEGINEWDRRTLLCTEGITTQMETPVQELKANHVIFTDASWKQGKAGLAAIMVNRSDGKWFFRTQSIVASTAMEAELRAILMALEWAIENNWKEIQILSDSQSITQALSKGVCPPDWKNFNVSLKIISLSKLLISCSFTYINRSGNSYADDLAKNARISSNSVDFVKGRVIPL